MMMIGELRLMTLILVLSAAVSTDFCVNPQKLDCAEIPYSLPGYQFNSGIYPIYAAGREPLRVYCDMDTEDGGWMVIQRRADGSTRFNRTWEEYEHGFGSPDKEFYIGNKYLHLITKGKQYVLRIEMTDWDGNYRFAEYSHFMVASSSRKYRLDSIGDYFGDAGDSLTYHVGHKFSTYDQDNDNWNNDCAKSYKGAWWYDSCHYSNLNGEYKTGGAHSTFADGINWQTWKGYNYSYKNVEMKIRPTGY